MRDEGVPYDLIPSVRNLAPLDSKDEGGRLSDRIANRIADAIDAKHFRQGGPLPEVSAIARHYDVSFDTAKAAIRKLEAEGVLRIAEGNRGSQAFVTGNPRSPDASKIVPRRFGRPVCAERTLIPLGTYLEQIRQEGHLTITEAARRSSMTSARWRQVITGKSAKPTLRTILCMAKAVGADPHGTIDAAGFDIDGQLKQAVIDEVFGSPADQVAKEREILLAGWLALVELDKHAERCVGPLSHRDYCEPCSRYAAAMLRGRPAEVSTRCAPARRWQEAVDQAHQLARRLQEGQERTPVGNLVPDG